MKTKSEELDINLPHRYRRKTSALHKVWQYMRWNRTFRYGDVLIVTGVSHSYLKNIIWHLKNIGYIKEHKRKKPYSATEFTLVKMTGIKSPSINNGIVYDYNTKEEFKIEIIPPLTKLLSSMTEPKMSKQTIAKKAGVNYAVAKSWFKKLTELGLIVEIKPIERVDGTKAFVIDLEKVEQLKLDVKSRIFKIKGALK